jgi:hypothetical protein
VTNDWRAELLDAYRRHRIDDQAHYYARRGIEYERARRWTVAASAGLLVLAALAGALGAAYAPQRAMWAFVAAALSAVATAINGFESAFGFERFSRRATETASALALADTHGPRVGLPATDEELLAYVVDIERLLRSEVDTWSQLAAKTSDSAGSRTP